MSFIVQWNNIMKRFVEATSYYLVTYHLLVSVQQLHGFEHNCNMLIIIRIKKHFFDKCIVIV